MLESTCIRRILIQLVEKQPRVLIIYFSWLNIARFFSYENSERLRFEKIRMRDLVKVKIKAKR